MLLCWTQKPRKAAAPAGHSAALRLSVPTPEPGRKGWADSRGKRNVKVPLLLPLTPNKLTTGKLKAQCALHDRLLDGTWFLFTREGVPRLTRLGFALADCLPGLVCPEEAASSGEESTEVNSDTRQPSRVPCRRETSSLCPSGGCGVATSAPPSSAKRVCRHPHWKRLHPGP